jgi:NTE family protein
MHEMRAIEFVQRLLHEHRLDPDRYRRVYLHMISAEACMSAYGVSSKYNTAPDFIDELFRLGRATAADWLDAKWSYVGHVGSVRIADHFL